MKFKCCQHLFHSLNLMLSHIQNCNELHGGEYFYSYEEQKAAPKCEEIMKIRNQLIENCKKGIYPKGCEGCPQFIEQEWNENQQITKLSIFHWVHCNCECEYCFQAMHRESFTDKVQKSAYYDAYPIIKELHEKEYLAPAKDFRFEIGGGEIALLEEFPQIMEVMLEHGFYFAYIMSSGIKYSETVQKMLQNPNVVFSVTISAGSREVFKRIKKRDKFEQVKENLVRYIQNAPDKNKIVVRYIIDEGYNDTEKDIKDWIDTCEEIGARCIDISIDFCRGFQNKKGQPYNKRLKKLVDYYLQECKKRNADQYKFYYTIDATTKLILDRGYY